MHAPSRSFPYALIALLAAMLALAGCGGEDGVGARDGGGGDAASSADGDGEGEGDEDGAGVRNGLLLAAQSAGDPGEQVAVWTGSKPPAATDPASVDIDPPLGLQPRASDDGATLAWLAPTRGGLQLWVRSGDADDDAKLVAITGEDGVLGVRSMDVSGDGEALVVATAGAKGASDGLWLVDVETGGAREVDLEAGTADGSYRLDEVASNDDASLLVVTLAHADCAGAARRCSAGFGVVPVTADGASTLDAIEQPGPRSRPASPVFGVDDELLFYVADGAVQSIPVEEFRESDGGTERVDPVMYVNGLKYGTVRGLTPSPDGELLAVAIGEGGGEGGELRIIQVSDGSTYATAAIPGVGTPVWVPADASDPAGFEPPATPAQ